MAAKEFIVAIELGSSKMTGIAGRKNLDGSITVLAVVTEKSSSFIRKGVIYNIDKTAQSLSNIVKKLEGQLKTRISKVFVGVGGQSIRSVKNVIVKELPAETKVTKEMVLELMDDNRNMKYPDQEVIDAAELEYKVDSQLQLDPVGIECSRLEGNYLNILERKTFYRTLNKCFETSGINIAEMFLAPFALADSVLTEAERRSGCALVDIGYDTTTVSVYFKNILRHLAVIPLGSNNITKDIAALQMEDEDAEKMKLKYASAYTEASDIDPKAKYRIDNDREIECSKFIDIVEARTEEIVNNVFNQIQLSKYEDKLLAGIVLTGGGSNMKNIEKAFNNISHIEKIRIAKFVTQTIDSNNPLITDHNGMMNTVLALLAKGNMNCAGGELNPNGDLFGEQNPQKSKEPEQPPRKINEVPQGVILTGKEKQMAEEEARKAKEAKEAAERQADAEKKQRELAEKKQNSLGNKVKKGIKGWFENIIKEEE